MMKKIREEEFNYLLKTPFAFVRVIFGLSTISEQRICSTPEVVEWTHLKIGIFLIIGAKVVEFPVTFNKIVPSCIGILFFSKSSIFIPVPIIFACFGNQRNSVKLSSPDYK